MTKAELVGAIALSTDIAGGTNAAASRVLELIISTIKTELKAGNEVNISGLCKFSTTTQAAKHGTIPGTTKLYSTPEKTVVKIKALKPLKDAVLQMNENKLEKEIQDKNLNAPRLTPESIDATIVGEAYYVFPETTTTICRLELRNGFSVIGESAAVSLDNFDEEIGQKVARDNARNKIWQLEGYLLRDKLFNMQQESKC